jgi:hypothetical protein
MATGALVDPEIEVRDLGNPEVFTTWHISQNLTDRLGEINDFDAENKPLDKLQHESGLLDRLREQMVDEITFVARKDGRFGILFEVECASQESEKNCRADDWANYPPHAELLRDLVEVVKVLQEEFSQVEWAIPNEREIANDRLAVWGYFPDGSLTLCQRKEVGQAIYNLCFSRM